jgi:hypothetical protein
MGTLILTVVAFLYGGPLVALVAFVASELVSLLIEK